MEPITVYHNEVYYWLYGERNAYALLKVLQQIKPCSSSQADWFNGHAQPMSQWPVINLS